MGFLHFLLPEREGLVKLAVDGAYLVGSDGMPWESRVEVTANRLSVWRNARESGQLVIPWPLAGFGPLALSTATLMSRDQPYHLALELCRGTLNRLLQYVDSLRVDDPLLRSALDAAKDHFIAASLQQANVEACARDAETSLQHSLEGLRICWQQSLATRPVPQAYSSRLTGFQTRSRQELEHYLHIRRVPGNAICHHVAWRHCEPSPGEWDWSEWKATLARCHNGRRRVVCGPLVHWERQSLPDWLYLWDDDFDTLQTYVEQYIRALVPELRSQSHIWYATSGTNVDRAFQLSEEHRLRLTLAVLESIRHEDRHSPVLIGIQQPWGEYLGRAPLDLAPTQFADILLRAELGISGLVLEINMGTETGQTLPRDPLEFQRLLDQWSVFGIPLVLSLSFATRPSIEESSRLDYLRDLLETCWRKPLVQGVFWSQLEDSSRDSAGVLTRDQHPKRLLGLLTEIFHQSRRSAG